ncbi:MAG TPA: endopeptidase La [Bacteroidales bacterium]
MEFKFNEAGLDEIESDDDLFPVLADINGGDDTFFNVDISETLPILPLRNMVLFPGVIMPVTVGRTKSMKLVKKAYQKKSLIGVVAQIVSNIDEPQFTDLYSIGTVAQIVRILEMPNGSTTVILQGRRRFKLTELVSSAPYFTGRVEALPETLNYLKGDKEFDALLVAIKETMIKMLKNMGSGSDESIFAIKNITHPMFFLNFICSNIQITTEEKQNLLTITDLKERGYKLIDHLNKEAQIVEIKARIQNKTHKDLDQQQREYFLQQQIKTIQNELGGNVYEQDIDEMQKKANALDLKPEVRLAINKEIDKLKRLHPQSPDFSTQMGYVENLVSLPWNIYTKDNFNLKTAQKVLDRDHFGLDQVKERIIEHLAVLKLKGDMKAPILCLYGPPGVGKTSLGKSVAAALKRKYVRISLGGLHDEAEIRGHRRTYIGAMPGRIIQALLKAGSSNPVFILDEIDKVGNDYKGDPASALLEVLDPEQNSAFHDNYIDIDFDLSKVLFIATANTLSTISKPLLDRMELIEVSGYIPEEKIEIARRHIVPKELENHGLPTKSVDFPKKTLGAIIEDYTRESGVRELEKKIAKVCRRLAKEKALDEAIPSTLAPELVEKYLGKPDYTKDKYQGNEYAGVVTGLAWTSVGGEILFVEASLSKGKEGKLTLTGNLGDVMKESAMLAMEYLKAHASYFGIPETAFSNWNVHIHVPEGAIPKDGPSAGVTMITSLVSAFTQRKVKSSLAMTGEITLRGKILPIGGVKEKLLAAKRAGIKEILLCEDNRKDVEEINDIYLKGVTFNYVSDIKELIALALTDEKVKDALTIE